MHISVFFEELFFFSIFFLYQGRIQFTYFLEKFELRKLNTSLCGKRLVPKNLYMFSLSDVKTLITLLDYQRNPNCFLIPLSFMISSLTDFWSLFLQGVGRAKWLLSALDPSSQKTETVSHLSRSTQQALHKYLIHSEKDCLGMFYISQSFPVKYNNDDWK